MGLEVALERGAWRPGEEVRGVVRWVLPPGARALHVELVGQEMAEFDRSSGGRRSSCLERRELCRTAMALSLQGPEGSAPFSLPLPRDALPSFQGGSGLVAWAIEARADVPLRPDPKARAALEVACEAPGPLRAVLEMPEGEPPRLAATLRCNRLAPGGALEGEVRVLEPGGARVRGARLQLRAEEWARAEGEEDRGTLARVVLAELGRDELASGAGRAFRAALPPDWPVCFEGALCGVRAVLEARVDVALGLDRVAEAPLGPAA